MTADLLLFPANHDGASEESARPEITDPQHGARAEGVPRPGKGDSERPSPLQYGRRLRVSPKPFSVGKVMRRRRLISSSTPVNPLPINIQITKASEGIRS